MRKKKLEGINKIKSRYGYMFTALWAIGFILFFAIPVCQSLWYSFSEITLSTEGVKTDFVGWKNYHFLFKEDIDFTANLVKSVTSFAYSLPVILIVSLVLALLLNQKFRGRLFFRALYFLPVIIASGVVLKLMFRTTDTNLANAGVSSALTSSMFSIQDVVRWLDLPEKAAQYVMNIINNIFDLIWSCGIQTVLFIAGLQSVPVSMYEAAKIEGVTKWQEFWFITFPMLGNITVLVVIFTTVDLFASRNNTVIDKAYSMMSSGIYDTTSAMLWIYFLIVGVTMGMLLLLYNRLLMRRWQ